MLRHLCDDDDEDLLQLARMTRRSIAPTKLEDGIPGRPAHVITTNAPKAAQVPAAPKKARAAMAVIETLKEKRARLQREIAELEGKRGKK